MAGIMSKAQGAALDAAVSYILRDPSRNFVRLLDLAEKFDVAGEHANQIRAVRPAAEDPDNNWNRFVVKLCEEVDHDVLRATVRNLIFNASILGMRRQAESREKYGCNVPWAILMDPTSACNLHCTGCWAAEYGNRLNMSYEELDSIINQANGLGTYFFLYSGGEPLVRKADIIRLCEAHPDCQFTAFTNGTLIDEAFAEDMLRVRNFIPAISVEGFEEDTDFRRGEGIFAAVERAMRILREKRLPFGISCCYTSKNVGMIGSEEYFDQMVEWGARFCWFFTYMPVGADAVPELMVTPEQRAFMYEQIHRFRETKPIFTLDFWNDGQYSDGCLAGGRVYLTSTPTATTSPARSSTTPTPTFAPTPWWRPCRRRCSPPTARGSRSTGTTCVRARCSTTRVRLCARCATPARTPPTCSPPRPSRTLRPSARGRRPPGPQSPTGSGRTGARSASAAVQPAGRGAGPGRCDREPRDRRRGVRLRRDAGGRQALGDRGRPHARLAWRADL